MPRSKGLGGGRSEGSCLGGQAGVLLYLCTQNTRRTAPGPPRLPWRGSAGVSAPACLPGGPADEPPGRVPALARLACRYGQVVVKKQNHRKVTASGACGSPRSRQLIPVCSAQPPCCCISLSCPRAALGPFPGTPEAAEVVMEARDLPARVPPASPVVSPCTWRGNPGAFLLLSCGFVPRGKGLPAAHAAITFKSFNQTLMARGLSW